MRVAFIGSSHLGALLDGWALLRDAGAPDVKASFLGSGFEHIVVEPGRLARARTSPPEALPPDVVNELQLADYDAFVLAGLFPWRSVLQLYGGYRAESHTDVQKDAQLVSDACFDAAVLGVSQAYPGWQVAKALRAVTARPIALLPQPRLRAGMLSHPKQGAFWTRMRDSGDDARLAASYEGAVRRLAGEDFALVEQPADTLETPVLTREEYSIGTVLRHGEPRYDTTHMNGAYGRLMLERCVDWARRTTAVG